MLRDVRTLSVERRHAAADQIRVLKDFDLPELEWFNSDPCDMHTTLKQGQNQIPPCQRCGIKFRKHQRVGIAWLYMRGQGLIADQVGPQPLDALVLTPSGYRAMGDLKVGDPVIDPEGHPSCVTGVYPQGEQDVYQVTFSDGTTARSTLGHLWQVRDHVGHKDYDIDIWHTRTLEEISKQVKFPVVPLIAHPPDFPEVETLPLDPYFLGVLLGTGVLSRNTAHFVASDQELLASVEHLRPAAWGWFCNKYRTSCDTFSLVGSPPLLRELGLYRIRAGQKFVPSQYKWASAKTRLAILQGLLDSSASHAKGSVRFCCTSRQLAQDVTDIVRSLGLQAIGPFSSEGVYTKKGKEKQGPTTYQACISETDDIRVFRLSRKLQKHPCSYHRVKAIEKVELVEHSSVQCISVSAPSQLYVTDNWTVTHNTGKTAQATGLIALLKQVGELDGQRVVVVCRPAALGQWLEELRRFLPKLTITAASGVRKQRSDKYRTSWEVLVIGYQMLVRDLNKILDFNPAVLIVDDVDALRSRYTQTARAIKCLARRSSRTVVFTGTPLQKRLSELHSVLEPLGGRAAIGSEAVFRRRFVREEINRVYNRHAGRVVGVRKIVGYQHLDEFVNLVSPMTLRRTPKDIDDVDLPAISPHTVFLDLHPAQRDRYAELRRGVLKIIKEEGSSIKHAKAVAQFIYGAQICAGLATLGETDRPGSSIKLDWVEKSLTDGDLSDEKVVVFCQFTNTISALLSRLTAAGIGSAVIWGREQDLAKRAQAKQRFWNDPDCRVLVGTSAIEQSLNLQVSRHLINVDQLMNPARMVQLAGRIRRDGSAYSTVYIHNLLARDTQEDGYLELLQHEQALADFVWGESSELHEALSPLALLQLIGK